ncbi:MAG: DUF3368 domain-containing protein [Pseudomonadota bacterium]
MASNTIVADSSPLIIAAHTGLLVHLPDILGVVFIPPKVSEECLQLGKPSANAIEDAIKCGILTVSTQIEHEFLTRIPSGVDAGEAEAIALALNLNAKLLIDDKKGRKIAKYEGLTVLGFAAILVKAKRSGIIDSVLPVIEQMNKVNYRISPRLLAEILQLCNE